VDRATTTTTTSETAKPEWVDLLDPTEAELRAVWPSDVHQQAVDALMQPHIHGDEPRPKIDSHGAYVLALLLDHGHLVTVRKTPPDGKPLDLSPLHAPCAGKPVGTVAYLITDWVAEGFLDMIDDLNEEIEELEDNVDSWDNEKVRRRLSDLRHDLLRIRRTLAPTRDAVRRIVDNHIDLDDEELFPHDVELQFDSSYDKLMRATEGLANARDLIAGVRDYHQSKVANDQNEVMKVLTIVAAVFLPPTFIVGLYGQNFGHMPELGWAQGYGFSWFLIIAVTAVQVWYFRRRKWL
jgi:magnesium/cobalt transport protein CorA